MHQPPCHRLRLQGRSLQLGQKQDAPRDVARRFQQAPHFHRRGGRQKVRKTTRLKPLLLLPRICTLGGEWPVQNTRQREHPIAGHKIGTASHRGNYSSGPNEQGRRDGRDPAHKVGPQEVLSPQDTLLSQGDGARSPFLSHHILRRRPAHLPGFQRHRQKPRFAEKLPQFAHLHQRTQGQRVAEH